MRQAVTAEEEERKQEEERDRAEGARRRWSKQAECEEKGRGGRVEKMQKELERQTAGAEEEEEE